MNSTIKSLSSVFTDWKEAIIEKSPNFIFAIVILVLFIFLAKVARKVSLSISSKNINKHTDIARIVASIVYFLFLFSGVFLALQIAGLEKFLTHVLAGAGIIGIIAGFAFKDIASNIFAGLLLRIQAPYKHGDWVQIDEKYGVVVNVNWITTTIRTVEGQKVYIPNQLIYGGTFTNFSSFKKRRVVLRTGVSYGDDLELVRNVSIEEVKKFDFLLEKEGVDFYYTDIGNSSYNFMLRFWIKFDSNDDYCKGVNEVIMCIKKRFDEEGISIPYPVTSLDFGGKGGTQLFDSNIQIKK